MVAALRDVVQHVCHGPFIILQHNQIALQIGMAHQGRVLLELCGVGPAGEGLPVDLLELLLVERGEGSHRRGSHEHRYLPRTSQRRQLRSVPAPPVSRRR